MRPAGAAGVSSVVARSDPTQLSTRTSGRHPGRRSAGAVEQAVAWPCAPAAALLWRKRGTYPELNLQHVELERVVPVDVEPPRRVVNLLVGHLECDGLVRLRREEQELEVRVRRALHALLEGRHEPVPRLAVDVGVLDLEEEAVLRHGEVVAVLLGRAPREIHLVLAALGMAQVGGVRRVEGEAEPALQLPEVVLLEVGVLPEVEGLEGKPAKAVAVVRRQVLGGGRASAAGFVAHPVLVVHLGGLHVTKTETESPETVMVLL
ncbi:GAF domain-containing protein [Babesia caballi]|uniref:GAF domain-containing protein n=1 Tax=Babesia caballi TaxID=5871 RepID=A0AAV4LVI1_BABCB|nr:GAF domain-containing protein [Babesia caballi]